MYFMGLSATRFFKHWPELAKEYDSISLHNAWIETFKHDGERMIPPSYVSERLRAQGLDPKTPPGTFQMRPLVYKMFVSQVEKLGVKVQFGKRIIDYREDEAKGKAYAISDQGEEYEADVIIAADGKWPLVNEMLKTLWVSFQGLPAHMELQASDQRAKSWSAVKFVP